MEKIPAPRATLAQTEGDSDTWFEDWYNSGGRTYLKINARTEEGRQAVVKFNNFESEWAELGGDDMTPSEQYHCIMKLLSQKKMKDDTYMGAIEMMHRLMATTQLLTNSTPDHFTAMIKEGTLLMRTFVELGVVGPKGKTPNISKFNNAVNKVFDPESNRYAMLDDEVNVTIFYANNPNVVATELLRALRTRSKYISAAKIHSARQPATSHIAQWGQSFITKMSTTAIAKHPSVENLKTNFIKRINQKEAEAKWKAGGEDPVTAWGLSDILQKKTIQQYIRDPTNVANYKKVANLLSVPSVEDKNVIIRPPFYLSYTHLAREPGHMEGGVYNLTGEMRNQILACPPIMTYLWASLKNQTAKEVSGDADLVKLIQYALGFHFGAASGQANLDTIHGAFVAQYGFEVKAQHTTNQLEGVFLVLPVTVMAVNMLNACISCASSGERDQSVDDIMKAVQQASLLFHGAFQAMESSIGTSTTSSTIYHLSKSNS